MEENKLKDEFDPLQDGEGEACPSCGAGMVFDAETGGLYCEHCGARQQIFAHAGEEQAFGKLLEQDNGWAGESHVFVCRNCGAREVLEKNETVSTCPFCGTEIIPSPGDLPGVRPNAVVPFRISREAAAENVKKWLQKRFFAPAEYRKSGKADALKGVYVPSFSFDARTETYYTATLGKYYYVDKIENGQNVRERKIRYFHVNGRYGARYDDIRIGAEREEFGKSLRDIGLQDASGDVEYKPEFLRGYAVSQSAKTGIQCWEEAKEVIGEREKKEILSGYTYDVVSSLKTHTNYYDITYKYVLLPVYVAQCSRKGKQYNIYVNGIDGKVAGKAPVSGVRVLVTVAVVFGILLLVGLLGA